MEVGKSSLVNGKLVTGSRFKRKEGPVEEKSLPADSVQFTNLQGTGANEAVLVTTTTETKAKSVEQKAPVERVDPNAPIATLDEPTPEKKSDPKFLAKYGPWGLVTGASGGIGSEFAHALAEKGMNVVLVARNQEKLQKTAAELRSEYGVETKIVTADLAKPEGLDKVKKSTDGLEVGMLVNNAGAWQFGSFLDNDIDKDVQTVALNVEAPMVLSHHFAGKMAKRGKGGVINVGSGAALHGVPGQAAYSATKGFLRNFTESLYKELKPKGVDVLITNPGPVHGEASGAYDQSKVPLQKVTGRDVADDALKRLGRRSSTIPGWFNKLAIGAAVRMMPRDMLSGIAGYLLERATPAETPAKEVAVAETAASSEKAAPVGTSATALKAVSKETAENAAGGVLGHLWGAVKAVTKPVTSAFSTVKFALGFMGDMRTRAEEISRDPGKVEKKLKAEGLHHEYQPPVNKANVKFEGKMLIKANMQEFFELWDSWISKGYGSINDRQYADLVLKFKDQAKNLPLLAYVPMTSEDVFSGEVKDGKMTNMKETTTARLGGLIPTSKVDWLYQRKGDPTGSNSFEKKIDDFDGDVGKVQAFYQDLFDPKHVNPESKASVTFVVREVENPPALEDSDREFTHGVRVPLGGVLPKPDSTLS